MKELPLDLNIQRNSNILFSNIDRETVMMSSENSEYYGLGETGSFIWENTQKSISINDLIEKIMKHFNVSKEKCKIDISPFIIEMIEKGLLVIQK